MKNTYILKNIIHIVCAGGIVGFVTFTGMINVAHATQPVPIAGTPVSGTFDTDVTWTKAGSPYILTEDVFVNGPHTFTIEAGVTIDLAPTRLNIPTAIYVTDGTLAINGTENDHVKITGIDKIRTSNSKIVVTYLDASTNGAGLMLFWSQGTIATSTFSHSSGGGLLLWSSNVNIWDSQIRDNAGSGITISDDAIGKPRNFLSIHNSIIVNNSGHSINSYSLGTIQAENNWWGSADGPQATSTNSRLNIVSGSINFTPWLTSEPLLGQKAPICCSSILFLPGLEATRLYKPDSLLGLTSLPNRLWEPNRNDDVRKLFLDSNGSSTDPSIYADEPMGNAFGFVGIYGSFMKFLDELAGQGTIKEWRSFGYDWRKPIAEVVAGRTVRATDSESLVETIEDLASRSKTGKITLIAHSNGGLVAKYLVKTLTDMGKEKLIDSMISVAVPYIGTPQAILSLLQGDNQAMFGGLILKKSVARELGKNMASSYSLLPSATYFSKVIGPTIAYASATSAPITTASAQDSFISLRTNGLLMTAGGILHSILDPFTWPATIARWAIVGWGNKTAKGIVYSNPSASATSATSSYSKVVTSMGDSTVVAQSAAYNSGTTTSINLPAISDTEQRTFNHMNILESNATKQVVRNIVTSSHGLSTSNTSSQNAKAIEDELIKIPGVTIGEPDYSKEATFLVVSTHSPVDLHVYDKNGNHTGTAPLPAGLDEDIEEGLLTYVERNIPGSSFETSGDENQLETFISLPDNSGEKYSITIQGTGVGEFTYGVQRIRGEVTLSSIEYAGLPVSPLMTASTTVTGGIQSTTTILSLDIDGNGSVDVMAKSNSTLDPIIFFESIKKVIIQLLGSNKDADSLIRRINRIEDLFRKNSLSRIDSSVNRLKQQIGSKRLTTLSQSDKDEIIKMIDQFLAQFE